MAAAQYIFVLWGSNFNEAAATIFVTELRQAGLRVKVVGLDGDSPVGVNGLALVPDMPLSKALPLAKRARCVIVPCDACQWQRIHDDPRLTDFLRQSQQGGARLISEGGQRVHTPPVDVLRSTAAAYRYDSNSTISHYPPPEALTFFVRALAESLG